MRAKASGLFHAAVPNGARVKKSEHIGTICDPYGEHEEKILCSQAGYVIGINNQPVVNEGDALMHIGIVDKQTS